MAYSWVSFCLLSIIVLLSLRMLQNVILLSVILLNVIVLVECHSAYWVLFCLLNVFLLAECHFVRSWLILLSVILHCVDVILHSVIPFSVILLNVVAPSMTEECVCIKFLMLTLVKRKEEPFLYPTVMTQSTQSKTLNKVISFCLFLW